MQKLSFLTHFGRPWRSWVKVKAGDRGSWLLFARRSWRSAGSLTATAFLRFLLL